MNTMNELFSILEIIGFDIVLLGVLTLLVLSVGKAMWRSKPSQFIEAFSNGLKRLVTGIKNQRSNALLLLPAALLGMVINLLADELLDSPSD